jgi:hypothetical protein
MKTAARSGGGGLAKRDAQHGEKSPIANDADPQAPTLRPLTESEIASRAPSWADNPLSGFWRMAGLAARTTVRPVHVFQIPRRPFTVATNAPSAIYLLSDRGGRPMGPTGFDRKSLAAVLGRVERVDIVSGAVEAPYIEAMGWAHATSFEALIVETVPEREAAWAAFVRKHTPQLPLRSWRIVVTSYPAARCSV